MTNSLEPSNTFSAEPSSNSPLWRWRLEDSSGGEVEAEGVGSPEFPSQSDAESWVGEAWRELLEAGVDAVTLLEGDREVYGPMSLHAS
jgi:hypothetical protein